MGNYVRWSHDRRPRGGAIITGFALLVALSALATQSGAAPASGPGSTGSFRAVTPLRILNTRPGPVNVGGTVGPVTSGQTFTLQVGGQNGVPSNATAVVLNVTVDATTAQSFLTVWPSDQARPDASNLNWSEGVTIPNLVTVQLSASGQVSFYNFNGNVNVLADLAGYYIPSNDKFISLPITGMQLNNTTLSEAFPGGIRFGDQVFGNYAGLVGSAVLPPDYTSGTAVTVNVQWVINGACTVALQANNLTVTRPGLAQITGGSTSAGLSVATATSPTANVVVETQATIESPSSGTPLLPGDSLLFGLFRRGDAGTDTCAGLTMIITGMSLSYN